MTRQELSNLIERAERIAAAIEKWGGIEGITNRIDLVDEYLNKMDAAKDVLVQLEKLNGKLYVFKALLTVDEAAAYLGVNSNTVRKLIKNHGLTTYNTPLSKILILTEDLVDWCKLYPNGESGSSLKPGIQKKKGTRK